MADMANYKESPRFATCSQLGVIHPKMAAHPAIHWKTCDPYNWTKRKYYRLIDFHCLLYITLLLQV